MLFAIIAVIGIVVAVIYLAEPAKSLPSFIPGHIAGSSGHHPLKATGGPASAKAQRQRSGPG